MAVEVCGLQWTIRCVNSRAFNVLRDNILCFKVMVNNVIFTDLKRQEALEKADEETLKQQPVMKYTRSKSFSYRRRSSVGQRRSSVMRRKSVHPLCVKVRFNDES